MSTHSDEDPEPVGGRGLNRWIGRLSPEMQASFTKAETLIDKYAGNTADSLNEEQREILKSRWVEQTKMYERLWRGQRTYYYLIRVPIIIGATTIPVLASLNVDKLATALVGLAVALLTGLDSFFQLRDRWQQHRRTATELGFEGWHFLELGSPTYKNKTRREAYGIFINQLESINRRSALSYLSLFQAGERDRSNAAGKPPPPEPAG